VVLVRGSADAQRGATLNMWVFSSALHFTDMGDARRRPKRLAKKLLQIRLHFGLSQKKLVQRMGMEDQIHYPNISKYELDKNEPPLVVLLAYSRVAEIPVESLIDDDVGLDAFIFRLEP